MGSKFTNSRFVESKTLILVHLYQLMLIICLITGKFRCWRTFTNKQ